MTPSRIALVTAAALVCASPLGAQHDSHAAGHAAGPALGRIVFDNSGNAAAQESFLRGVAFLHSYEYANAATAFREAQRADPALAVSYWMEALTYSRIDWR